jgi:hypothetical protein
MSRSASSAPARPFDGLTPAEIQAAGPIFHEAFRQAEREGYDAVVPLGMLDIGVEGGRSAVDIPVVAPLQAVLHVAAQVGEHFGVVCYHPSAIPRHRAQCIAYGMESFIAGRRASGFYLQHIADNKDKLESPSPRLRAIAEDGADGSFPRASRNAGQMKPAASAQPASWEGSARRSAWPMLAALGLKQSRVRWQKQAAAADLPPLGGGGGSRGYRRVSHDPHLTLPQGRREIRQPVREPTTVARHRHLHRQVCVHHVILADVLLTRGCRR